MIYLQLFWSFFQIGLFSIGGGYAAMPLIETQAVHLHGWLTMETFADLVTISEMTPGPITINSSTFVGMQVAGFPGALAATFGCIAPSCMIILFLAWIYGKYRQGWVFDSVLRGLRPAVVGMIASAGLSLLLLALWGGVPTVATLRQVDLIAIAILVGAFYCLRRFRLGPIPILLASGAVGLLCY